MGNLGPAPDPLWVFGYGSLVWRPDIPFDHAVFARVHGFVRRFWQGSTDHRGVPGAPGRVATLIPEAHGTVVGRAYRVPDAARDEVLARLDHREKGGYERAIVPVHPLRDCPPLARALIYRATPDNPNWLGPASAVAIARTVANSVGPSGPNDAYVLRLYHALAEVQGVDEHLQAIVDALSAR